MANGGVGAPTDYLRIEDLAHEIETPDDSVFGSIKLVIQILRKPSGMFVPHVLRKDRFQLSLSTMKLVLV